MQRGTAVTLRDNPPPPPKPVLETFKAPKEVSDYLRDASLKSGITKTDIILGGIALEQVLSERLMDRKAELRAFAESRGLDLALRFPEVIAELVSRGLDASKRETASPERKSKGGK